MTTGLNYDQIVQQITVYSNVFAYVAFSITPQQIHWLSANPMYPAAFISPGGKDVGENEVSSSGDLRQEVTEHFTVCVLFANDGDMLGQGAASAVTTYREALRKAIVNWHPLPQNRTPHPVVEHDDNLFIFEGGARGGWLFQYSIQYQIETNDCYTPASVPMTRIDVITINQVAGEG